MTGWRSTLRGALACGTPVVGTFVKSADQSISEVLALAGFDFLVADLEHSRLTIGDVEAIVRAAEPSEVPVLARMSPRALDTAGRLLESGAIGIQVTDVTTVETLAALREVTRFPPRGRRSLSLSHRAAGFGRVSAVEYLQAAENELVTIAQIESRAGVEALPGLLASADAPDVWFLGPFDISSDLGHPGDLDDPEVRAVCATALERLRDHRACVGVFARTPDEAKQWLGAGARFVLLASDVTLLASAARAVLVELAAPLQVP